MAGTTRRATLMMGLLLAAGAALAESRSLITDGSFEQGPPPASAWTESANAPCERIGDHSGDWYVSAYHGSLDYWVAGFCYDEGTGETLPVTGAVTQTLTIPADTTVLTFYYIAFRPTSDDAPLDGDRAYVAVGGTELWTLPLVQANDSYPNWVGPVELDLSAYAGQSIELAIGGVSEGEATGNARIDDVELVASATPAAHLSWSAVKALYR
jgi:hypothetical protein